MESISVGVDIGSAAIKVVVLSQRGQLMHSAYVPHHYRVRETLRILWRQLMAIDAGLERLRHAVLEKGTDDDR